MAIKTYKPVYAIDSFYETGVSAMENIKRMTPKVSAEDFIALIYCVGFEMGYKAALDTSGAETPL